MSSREMRFAIYCSLGCLLAPSTSGGGARSHFWSVFSSPLTCHRDATANKPAVLTFPHLANDNPPDSKFWKLNNKAYFSEHSRNMLSGCCSASLWLHIVFWCNPTSFTLPEGVILPPPSLPLGGHTHGVYRFCGPHEHCLWRPWLIFLEECIRICGNSRHVDLTG